MSVTATVDEFYHYTSFAGLQGILISRTLRATSIHYLNDQEEYRHGRMTILAAVEAELKRSPESKLLFSILEAVRAWRQPHVFVFSLSKAPDLLSQWRGYCPDGLGCAIGFPRQLLDRRAQVHGFEFVSCIYEASKQHEAVITLLMEALAEEQATSDPLSIVRDHYVLRLLQLVPRLKHDTFSEEEEWRLISPMLNNGNPRFGFSTGRSMLIPHFNFTLADGESDLVELGKIYLGPNPNTGLAIESLNTFLHSLHNVRWSSLTSSRVPYRKL